MVARKPFDFRLPLLLLVLSFFAGCSNHAPAPISSRPQPPTDKIDTHTISSGETLYSIAWRYDLDHRKLAAANGIKAPYTIYVGQRLTLDLSKTPVVVASKPKPNSKKRVSSERKTAPTRSKTVKPAPAKVASKPQQQVASNAAKNSNTRKPAASSALPKTWKWRWPVKGKVVRYYDVNKRFKGIHLHAKQGTAVKAAGPGIVVYAGNGLHSYGRSIIVKHNDVYLSFYALNRRLLVKEGDRVSAGQTIAEVGGDVNEPNRIYFEIRRDGNSTDPIRLLPKQ